MRNVLALLRRELNAYFSSVLGYVVIVIFLIVSGGLFWQIVKYLQRTVTSSAPMAELFGVSPLLALVLVPVITMRLISEEKKTGTIEMLMTAPVTDFQVVLAKYLGAVGLYAFMWALTGLFVLILRHFSVGASLDLKQVFAGYICILFMGQFFVSIGLLASALSKNQIVGALIAFASLSVILFATLWESNSLAGKPAEFFKYVSPISHMGDFTRGIMDVRTLVLYVTGTVFVLFVTTRVVESRKWR